MAGEPDDSNVVAGDGPGAGYVQRAGIIGLAAYLLVLTVVIACLLAAWWPRCDPNLAAASTPNAPGTPSGAAPAPDKGTGAAGGETGQPSPPPKDQSPPPKGKPAPPKIEHLDPTSGSTAGGEAVTLGGTGFQSGAKVFFGNAPAINPTVASASKITASTPAHAVAEKVDVKVTQDNGSDILPGGYTYEASKTEKPSNTGTVVKVISVSPKSGDVAGGASVQIAGEGFLDNPTVTFGASPAAEVHRNSATQIAAKTPPHAEGAVDVVVTNSDTSKSSGTLRAGFTYECINLCRSRLLVLVLLAGALGGCFHALRSLWMFVGNRSLKQSWALMYVCLPFNGAVLAFIFFIIISAGTGFFTQPQGSNSCFWIIGIAALVGLFSQQATEKLKKIADSFFTTVSPKADPLSGGLSITKIDPPKGKVEGGETVTITGTGFTRNSTVTFGGKAATNLKFASASSIAVDTPPNQGPVDVTVTDPGTTTTAVKQSGFTYE